MPEVKKNDIISCTRNGSKIVCKVETVVEYGPTPDSWIVRAYQLDNKHIRLFEMKNVELASTLQIQQYKDTLKRFKQYTIIVDRKGTERKRIGTLNELNLHFGKNAKTIGQLIKQIQKDYSEREAACYERTFIRKG